MYRRRNDARTEYRQQEDQRIKDSASLADKFRTLKSLTVDLAYYESDGVSKTGQIKYVVNLAHEKSVFSLSCPNDECIGGDFDLSHELADAVAAHRTTATGTKRCDGWRNKAAVGTLHCHNILRYTLTLGY